MKKLILKHLNSNYYLSPRSLIDYKIYETNSCESETIFGVLKLVAKIFSVDQEEVKPILNEWMDMKAIELNNRIVDIQYAIYEKTGVNVNLTSEIISEVEEEIINEHFHVGLVGQISENNSTQHDPEV